MRKVVNVQSLVTGIAIGTCISATTVFASQWIVSQNPFPIKVDNVSQEVDALNINDRTYIQLNDLSKITGLGLEFRDSTIYITTAGQASSATKSDDDQYISESKAKEIALAHAKLTESVVTSLKVKMEIEDGVMEYKVEFRNGGYEYEYELDALTGTIKDFDKELEKN